MRFERVPSLNDDPLYVRALADLVRRRYEEDLKKHLVIVGGSIRVAAPYYAQIGGGAGLDLVITLVERGAAWAARS